MLGRNASQAERSDHALLPPISFRYFPGSAGSQERAQTQWREPRHRGITSGDVGDGRGIEVIVMVVGENYDVDRRQAVEIHSWRDPATGPDELQWRSSLAPDWIGENIEPCNLEQEARVSDPRDRELVWRNPPSGR